MPSKAGARRWQKKGAEAAKLTADVCSRCKKREVDGHDNWCPQTAELIETPGPGALVVRFFQPDPNVDVRLPAGWVERPSPPAATAGRITRRRPRTGLQRLAQVVGEPCQEPGCGRPAGWPHSVLCAHDPSRLEQAAEKREVS